jgi:hypothetical protein
MKLFMRWLICDAVSFNLLFFKICLAYTNIFYSKLLILQAILIFWLLFILLIQTSKFPAGKHYLPTFIRTEIIQNLISSHTSPIPPFLPISHMMLGRQMH